MVDKDGNVLVTDGAANNIRKINTNSVVSTLAGNGKLANVDGPANTASFFYPGGVVVTNTGLIYVT
jgi:hypothetical protein